MVDDVIVRVWAVFVWRVLEARPVALVVWRGRSIVASVGLLASSDAALASRGDFLNDVSVGLLAAVVAVCVVVVAADAASIAEVGKDEKPNARGVQLWFCVADAVVIVIVVEVVVEVDTMDGAVDMVGFDTAAGIGVGVGCKAR